MAKILFFLFFLLTSHSSSNSKRKIPIISDTVPRVNHLNISSFQTVNHVLSMDTVRHHYRSNDITSGRMNSPKLLENYNFLNKQYFGYYNVIDRNSKLKPAIISKVLVSFEEQPWNYDGDQQEIIAIIVRDRLFKYNPFSLRIGDNIKEISSSFVEQKNIGSICYFQSENYILAVKLEEEIISRYIIWKCESSNFDFKGKHTIVENYLK